MDAIFGALFPSARGAIVNIMLIGIVVFALIGWLLRLLSGDNPASKIVVKYLEKFLVWLGGGLFGALGMMLFLALWKPDFFNVLFGDLFIWASKKQLGWHEWMIGPKMGLDQNTKTVVNLLFSKWSLATVLVTMILQVPGKAIMRWVMSGFPVREPYRKTIAFFRMMRRSNVQTVTPIPNAKAVPAPQVRAPNAPPVVRTAAPPPPRDTRKA